MKLFNEFIRIILKKNQKEIERGDSSKIYKKKQTTNPPK